MTTFTYQERFRTAKGVFDENTERTIFKLQSQELFDELVSPLEVGKESNVFIASKDDKKVIVKIYRVQNADFKRMYDYIRKDSRYEGLKNHRRQIIFAWTQREYKNLIRAHRGNVNVPEVFGCKNNILVEEFIGDDEPALPLKDAITAYPHQFLQDIVTEMTKLYKSGLIHGDLSSFNILNHNEKPVLIDFSQATLIKTPNSEELLHRDIKNVLQFFKKIKIEEDPQKLFKMITGKE